MPALMWGSATLTLPNLHWSENGGELLQDDAKLSFTWADSFTCRESFTWQTSQKFWSEVVGSGLAREILGKPGSGGFWGGVDEDANKLLFWETIEEHAHLTMTVQIPSEVRATGIPRNQADLDRLFSILEEVRASLYPQVGLAYRKAANSAFRSRSVGVAYNIEVVLDGGLDALPLWWWIAATVRMYLNPRYADSRLLPAAASVLWFFQEESKTWDSSWDSSSDAKDSYGLYKRLISGDSSPVSACRYIQSSCGPLDLHDYTREDGDGDEGEDDEPF